MDPSNQPKRTAGRPRKYTTNQERTRAKKRQNLESKARVREASRLRETTKEADRDASELTVVQFDGHVEHMSRERHDANPDGSSWQSHQIAASGLI